MSQRASSEISSSRNMPLVPHLARKGQSHACPENSRVEVGGMACPDSLAFFRRASGIVWYRLVTSCYTFAGIKHRECVFSCVICGGIRGPLSPLLPFHNGGPLGAQTIAPFCRNAGGVSWSLTASWSECGACTVCS